MSDPTAEELKSAVAPEPATSVTPVGESFNPDRVVAVVPSKTLSPIGNTSICSVSVAPVVKVKLPEKSVGVVYEVGL